jgi:enamine deaminase RidA (YjgF/YER057c/UK114 family)
LKNAQLAHAVLLQRLPTWQAQVLGAICFYDAGEGEMPVMDSTIPCLQVPLRPLPKSDAMCEVWYSDTPVVSGQEGSVRYRCNDEVIFGTLVLAETNPANAAPLQTTAASAYQQISELLDKLDYSHALRYWNYMADINGHSHGLERYRQFNVGRQQGLLAQGREVAGSVPAACALGAPSGGLRIAFLAGRVAPVAIENPRQMSAYRYPQVYGPRTPTFSRASLSRWSGGECLFISGTASIVGHESQHLGDVIGQTQETLNNIAAVLVVANQQASHGEFTLQDLQYTVYVKRADDLAQIQSVLEARVGVNAEVIYVQADVCRVELLVEIEAVLVLTQRTNQERI